MSGIPRLPKPRPLKPKERQWVLKNINLAHHATMRMAWGLAHRFHTRNANIFVRQYAEELFPVAVIGMCVGVQRWRRGKGAKLSSHVYTWIRGYLSHAKAESVTRFGAVKKPHRMPLFSEIDYLVSHHSDNHTFDVWDHRWAEPQDEAELSPELALLMHLVLGDGRDLRVVRSRVFAGRTLEDIGREEGVSKERIRQVESRALTRLRKSSGFVRALQKQLDRHRMHINTDDFFGTNVGVTPQPSRYKKVNDE
jgi:RNA polymerase sigma factor (sigma-70 family)